MKFRHPPFHNRGVGPRERPAPVDEPEPMDEEVEPGGKGEGEYLRHLVEERTPVVVQMVSGENFRGYIEYYDRRFIRLSRKGAPNLFIFKQDIKYLYEE